MRDVAVLGVGMHPFGKLENKSIKDLCRHAVSEALKDAGIRWHEVQAIAAGSSRFSGGKGWGLNGNDVSEDMGSTGLPIYNLSAGGAAAGNAFNVGHLLVATGVHDMVLVVGGEKMPAGFIQTSGVEDETDLEFLRQRCIGLPGPAFWGLLAQRRMMDYGTTEEHYAAAVVKAHKLGVHNPYARFQKEFSQEQVLKSAMVNDPLRLFEICPVSDGAAAVILCSAERARRATASPVLVASSCAATNLFGDGLLRGVSTPLPADGRFMHSECDSAVRKAMELAGMGHQDIDLIELQDNTPYYELAWPEEWGFCAPGESDRMVLQGETMPTGRLPINPSGGLTCFGEASTAVGLVQACEITWQLRGQAGGRQVPNARVGLMQSTGLGGNGAAAILKR
ncbi:thiolase C-terminal domain-containing protein [Denitratisoma oestradiolicum]|uniref:Transporter n=1 Tax=Denitratisoma oestradiolicum TaxID=311182 RepID=A0A6S6Y5R9_9PROT|nr:transporter [Denitratisoma oestradiolicum]TWO81842.1 hypothetical protein CBW56_03835 [Denitratisoma oestradiolicum]CAB1370810.1 Transporter [Denitratisoma oestradiolicum]